jgi:hypothetical protein
MALLSLERCLCNDDTSAGLPADSAGHHVSGRGADSGVDGEPDHEPGDGCTCDAHGQAAPPVTAGAAAPVELRKVRLRARAARLDAFACRACGAKSLDMVEGPFVFFRCEPCAAADRWPTPAAR